MTVLARIYGTDEPPASWVRLAAGPLQVDFEGGQLRYVRFAGHEVLRGISFLVRDRYWGTYPFEVKDLEVATNSEQFVVRYNGRAAPFDGDLRVAVEIVGEAAGRLSFTATGAPVGDLVTNRTGFVVLHPLRGLAGARVEVEHASGPRVAHVLPELVSPHEPITDISAISHTVAPGLTARVELTGDVYDMEDQRNWTDASFKTYIRPLSRPKPYILAAGVPIAQSVTVVVDGHAQAAKPAPPGVVTPAERLGKVPRIALCVESDDAEASVSLVANLGCPVDIIGRPRLPEDIRKLANVAAASGGHLDLQFAIPGVHPSDELQPWAEVGALADVASVLVSPYRLYPLRPDGEAMGSASLAAIADATRTAFPQAFVGGGTMTGFTEFNRNPPPLEAVDFVVHGTSAIVHSADDRSVAETLQALPYIFQSGRVLAGRLPYRVGPATIGLTLNPDGPPRQSSGGRATMVRDDPRQRGLFAAAWTVGYAAAAIAADVQSFAPGHVSGELGLFEPDGSLRPAFHIVRLFAQLVGQQAYALSGLPQGCAGFRAGDCTLVANISPDLVDVQLPRVSEVALLDSSHFQSARSQPHFLDMGALSAERLNLQPFSIARLLT